jgi:hypothetical protein
LIKPWFEGQKIKHWNIINTLTNAPENQVDPEKYRTQRTNLDDFVHGTHQALKFYPAQSPSPITLDKNSFHKITFWKNMIRLYLIACLLVVYHTSIKYKTKAKQYLKHFGFDEDSKNI